MNGVTNVVDLFIVPGIFAALCFGVIVCMFWSINRVRKRAYQTTIDRNSKEYEALRALVAANDQVVLFFEQNRATAETFPQDVREAVYAAAAKCSNVEGRYEERFPSRRSLGSG